MIPTVPSSGDPIAQMIQLRLQLAELERQIDALKPDFYAACAAAARDGKQFERDGVVFSRRLSPGKWDYSDDIRQQEDLLKRLRRDFQRSHEPVSGREIIWTLKMNP